MSLRSKAFLFALLVFAVFFVTSSYLWLMQHDKDSVAESSLRRLMSQTLVVAISESEQQAKALVKAVKHQGRVEGMQLVANLSDSRGVSQTQPVDFIFVVNSFGKAEWQYFRAGLPLSEDQQQAMVKTLGSQLSGIHQLKNGVAYFKQDPLYVLADVTENEHQKIVVGYFLESIFETVERHYGFNARLASVDTGESSSGNMLRGEVKVPGLISSPVSVWIEDSNASQKQFNSLFVLLVIIGASLGFFLWWFWRKHLIQRTQSFIDQAHRINAEQAYQKRIKIPGDDELTELVGHYNSVLSTLEYSYNLMVKSNLITTELISKVQANTEPGSVGNDAVDQQEEDELKQSLDMVNRLSEAVDQGLLELYFQPVFDVNHEKVIQVEALCRWLDSERGMIPPVDFIALAEKSGQMPGLTNHVISQACESIREFQGRWFQPFAVSINLSLTQFVQPNLLSIVAEAINKYDIQPLQLEFEIKEHTVARDIDKAADIIAKLHDMGVGICIDDFGLSKFSLMYLQRLPVSKIKLSKSFVDRLERNAKEAAFIDGIARFSQGLNVRVVAKGVQTEQQLYALEKIQMLDCQGYALASPMAKDQFVDWYEERVTESADS